MLAEVEAANLPMNLVLILEQTQRDRVNWRIAPSLVEETTSPVKVVEVIDVLLRSKPVKVTNLKVGPL